MKRITIIGLILVILIQFIPSRIDELESDPQSDFINAESIPEEMAHILKNSCYDCHSASTRLPWYSKIAPVKWFINKHINEGREELNFSLWTSYSEKKKRHKLDECYELIGENEMPLTSYLWLHSDSKLEESEKQILNEWILSRVQ